IREDVQEAITRFLSRLGEQAAYAVRSSATAEDLPTASFAGQQDTYLNVIGKPAILAHVSRCWASLFTERAVTYRRRNGFDDRKVHMAVVVQQMVFPQAAGILFTADPVTSNRKVASVEASFGLGEALVLGLVNPDVYKVRDGEVVAKAVGTKQLAIHASPAGGTREVAIDPQLQDQPALTDAQVVRLAQLGRRIEAHFGRPQDIEWCLVDDGFQIVQSRPITTLFPIPESGDRENHVYVSVGHQQMMTDPMKPLGLSFWQMTTPARMTEAGGRLFVDVTQRLASPASRAGLLEALGRSDPLTGDALRTVLERDGFIRPLPEGPPGPLFGGAPAPIETDPAIATELIGRSQASIAASEREIRTKSGEALLDFIQADIQELKRILFDPQSHQVFMSAMEAAWWLNDQLQAWLGEKNAADTLTQSVPHNVTSEMGLALLDVADVIRPHRTWWLSCSTSRTRASWTSWPSSRAGGKRETPSRRGSTGTACAASVRSTSRGRVGASAPPRSCPSSSATSRTSSRAPARGASSKGVRRHGRRNRTCWSACGPCRTGSGSPQRPSG
ncbi:MAG: PEP/pyruvate-binding domain-containing protein, partial [Mycobacterium leprae]